VATKLTGRRVFGIHWPSRSRPGSRRSRRRKLPTALTLILVAAAIQSLAWAIALPAFQGPDESDHFAYVQYLAETGSLPSSSTGQASHSAELRGTLEDLNLNSLIGDLGARPGWSSADLALWQRDQRALPAGSRSDGDGPNPIAKNPPLYYALMAVPYRLFVWLPLLQRVFVLRLFNALCFLATIALTWLLAGELFGPVRWKQALAAGAVALEPQLAFMSAVINADNLLITFTTGFLLAAVRLVKHGPSARRVAAVSALSAAAILTHGRGLVTLPVLCVALVVTWIRHRPPLRVSARGGAIAGAFALVALLVDYLSQNSSGGGSLYGGQVSTLNTGLFNLRQFLSFSYQFFFPKLSFLERRIGPNYGYRQVFINTFYATFGSLEVTFKTRVYDILQLLSALGLVGFSITCVARWRTLKRSWAPVIVMLALAVTLVVFLLYVSYQALLADGASDPLIVGRYLLPMVSLFGVAIAFTVGSLPRRAGAVLAAVILSGGLLLAVGGIGITAARFYV
jgi:4-amino-4-deoxy-L-arabinose transferase-like glycosyltransferase